MAGTPNKTKKFNDAATSTTEIGFFMPPAEDSSNRVVNALTKKLSESTKSINIVLFLTRQPLDPRVDQTKLLARKRFLHSTLLEDIVFPFQKLNKTYNTDNMLLGPELLADKYKDRVRVVYVDNPNDPEFIKKHITDNAALQMAFSIRNLTIFKEAIIEAFAQKGKSNFLNLHPAALPDIRGLEGPFWTLYTGKSEFCTTLIEIATPVDSGGELDYETMSVHGHCSTKSLAAYTREAAPEVAAMIYKHLHMVLIKKGHRLGITQDEKKSRKYSLPTEAQLSEIFVGPSPKRVMINGKPVKFVDGSEQIAYLHDFYSDKTARPDQYNRLTELLWKAYSDYRAGNYKKPSDEDLTMDYDDGIFVPEKPVP